MQSIAQALGSMLPLFASLGEEEVHLTESSGRYVSREVTAGFDAPAFDNSAMDGYAVRAIDVASASADGPVLMPVRGESRAGGPLPAPLAPGTACRIFTGAPMPPGSDAVVIQEDTERRDEEVEIREASQAGKHVRIKGSDVASGALLLRTGDRMWPGEIGLLASQNIDGIQVFRRPRVAVLSTGDELRELGDKLEPGMIINSNSYVLPEMLRALGAVPIALPPAPDALAGLEASLRSALDADVVITTGGVSVGEYDFVNQAFENVGIEQVFWKVRMKPGKPVSFAQYRGKPVIGLPGNPISAMIGFEVLVAPCLRKMLGDPRPHPQPLVAKLRDSYRRRPGRPEIARAVASREGGDIIVTLQSLQGSGSLPSFVGVNALVLLPADRGDLEAGEEVETLLWGAGLRGETSFFDGLS